MTDVRQSNKNGKQIKNNIDHYENLLQRTYFHDNFIILKTHRKCCLCVVDRTLWVKNASD